MLTTVLDVESELEGLLELTVGACGSHLQNHREFSESRQGCNIMTHKRWENSAKMQLHKK